MTLRYELISLVLAGTSLTAGPVLADDSGAKRSVEGQYRYTVMEGVKYSFLAVLANLKSAPEMPASHIADAAESLNKFAGMSLDSFETDTRSQTEPSKSKPAVWEDWADFSAKMETFVADTAALSAAAESGDKAAIGAAFKKVGGNCKACHDKYRAD